MGLLLNNLLFYYILFVFIVLCFVWDKGGNIFLNILNVGCVIRLMWMFFIVKIIIIVINSKIIMVVIV